MAYLPIAKHVLRILLRLRGFNQEDQTAVYTFATELERIEKQSPEDLINFLPTELWSEVFRSTAEEAARLRRQVNSLENQLELAKEDLECVHMALDRQQVPRMNQAMTLSLWGRVTRYAEMFVTKHPFNEQVVRLQQENERLEHALKAKRGEIAILEQERTHLRV